MSLFEQKSLLAKLMASENMIIRQGHVDTASFDVLNRVLTVPVLDKDVSKDIYDLFMGHECGHALWTPLEGMKKAKAEKVNMSVLNVVEDSRIERRIKTRYPGIKTPFINAYNILHTDNFFETEGKDLNELNFIDRVNLHCKVGAHMAIEFNDEERSLLQEVENTETFDDVIEVTKKICDFMKNDLIEKAQEQAKIKVRVLVDDLGDEENQQGEQKDDGEEPDITIDMREQPNSDEQGEKSDLKSEQPESSEEDSTEQGDSSEGQSSNGAEAGINMKEIEEQIRSFTDDAYKRNENNLFSKDQSRYVYANIPKVDTKSIMDYKDMMNLMAADGFTGNTKTFLDYRRESAKVVSHLVKEFELRKNAEQMKRATTAKTGDLNMNRLYSYSFTEDIFKKSTVVPNGQSHGLVMFLDWSGSMTNHIANTTKQLLNLVLFCKKVNIPYEVYCFIDSPDSSYVITASRKDDDLALGQFGLVNLLSSRMSSFEFTFCAAALMKMSGIGAAYRYANHRPRFLQMSGTPLNETVIAAMEIVPEFQKKNRLQIVNTVFLTDGEGMNLSRVYNGGYPQTKQFTHMVVRDPVTRMEEVIDRHDYCGSQTDNLIRLLKARTNSHVIGFFVGTAKDITSRMDYFFPEHRKMEGTTRIQHTEDTKEKFRKENSLVVTATGYDDYYVLRSNGLDTDDDAELEFSEKATTRGMVTAFSKYASNKTTSRVVLNRFIELIS